MVLILNHVAITNDDGEVVADDFPPDYNYLQESEKYN
jgi:hypothetical protein